MAKQIKTSIVINAAPEKVWKVLTDFNSYPAWNPFVKSVEGEVAVNNRIKIQLPGMKFQPRILAYEPAREFRWLGSLLFKGIFDGEHQFILQKNEDGSTTLVHGEQFSGLLVPLLSKKLDTETRAGFEEMNRALKSRVEALYN